MSNDTSKPDPFDPALLRIAPTSEAASGVKKVLLHVPVRKPNRQEFFRTRPDSDYRAPVATLELKEEREIYVVAPSLVPELAGEVRLVEIRLCINRSGVVFLWPVTLPAEDGRSNPWHETAREAAVLAEANWVRMSANMGAGCYDVSQAPEGLSEPKWPEQSLHELLRLAFCKGKLIDAFDHPVLKRLRGE